MPGVQTVAKGSGFGAPVPKGSAIGQEPTDSKLNSQAEGLGKALMELGQKIGEAEQLVAKLRHDPSQLQAQVLSVEELTLQREVRDKADDVSRRLKVELGTWAVTMDMLRASVANNPDMLEVVTGLDKGRNALQLRLQNISTAIAKSHRASQLDAFVEGESLRMSVACKLRACVEGKGGDVASVFDAVDKHRRGTVNQAVLRECLESNGKQLRAAELETFIAAARGGVTDADKTSAQNVDLSRDELNRAIRVFYKVVKPLVVSDGLAIQNCTQLRRMDPGEILEVLEGPKEEGTVGVTRVRGRAWRDALTGWATISGNSNSGVLFLADAVGVMRVLHPVAITEGLEAGAASVRTLFQGELLQVKEWGQTTINGQSVTRVQVWAMSDGASGWTSLSEDGGTPHLEAI